MEETLGKMTLQKTGLVTSLWWTEAGKWSRAIMKEEEWNLLDQKQKSLYMQITMENYENVSAVGKKLGSIALPRQENHWRKMYVCTDLHLMSCQRVHIPGKEYRWQDHGKCSVYNSHIVSYTIDQRRQEPYRCQHCWKCFVWKSQLLIHQSVHTGEKPFKCQQCGKCVALKSHLKSHLKVHTGEKPFKCQQCGNVLLSSHP
ncbi:putative zinc finger protein 702 isoform X2 [Sceloporus undulatus]|uniref:putative zinc finger protein 702 isoform X2 n=1 Tax=Sceloporus undulatus TaxID=8520 RepID=UPI001C4D84E3|nr:putative zinc finger protein 702 isoform X2 [Sceloporus undulatus]XP_042309092.1 putative zinc finger protein 702 isoform X2 [Sceloporus undulatus]